MRLNALALLTAAILWCAALPASAHHSMSMFDLEKQVTYAGVVQKFNFTNPHIYIFLNVERNGASETMRVEGPSPLQLTRIGWSSKALAEGDRISITIRPSKDPQSNFGMLMWVVKPDGKKLEAGSAENPQQ